jgi:hypothetical protein
VKKFKRWGIPTAMLIFLTIVVGIYALESSDFEKVRLGLGQHHNTAASYVDAITKSAKAHDYGTAEMLLSFLTIYHQDSVDEKVYHSVYPEQRTQVLIKRWNDYLKYHPHSYPTLMHKAMLLWQLGEKRESFQVLYSLLKVDPNDARLITMLNSFGKKMD